MRVEVKRPAECSDAEIEAFRALVASGGEVTAIGLEGRVKAAMLLSFMRRGPDLIGVAGLKQPSTHHRKEVQSGSGIPLEAADTPLELGWVYVRPEHWGGKSMPLCAPLIERIGTKGVFATSRANNAPMHRTLAKLGFERCGGEWPSGLNSEKLWLFVRRLAKSMPRVAKS